MKRFLLRRGDDRGANLVEFAMVMPFLLLLLIGIVEFSWTFATNLDVKQGAREGARITAVSYEGYDETQLAGEICSRMDLVGSAPTTITWTSTDTDGDSTIEVSEKVEVTVSTPHETLTGFLDWAFSSVTDLTSTVEIRIEQPPTWSDATVTCPS